MKKATIQISYNAEKLAAVRQYMGKKDAELITELENFVQKLYEKYVPVPVREYIENRDSDEAATSRRFSRQAASSRQSELSANESE